MVNTFTSRLARTCATAFATLLFTGCASLYQVDCSSADWFTVGFNDGTNGMQPSRLTDHRTACEKSGDLFDTDRYQLGHENGLERYCTTESGLAAGMNGRAYRGVCADDSEKSFLSGYLLGSSSRRNR